MSIKGDAPHGTPTVTLEPLESSCTTIATAANAPRSIHRHAELTYAIIVVGIACAAPSSACACVLLALSSASQSCTCITVNVHDCH
jgi:hypothetical protein